MKILVTYSSLTGNTKKLAQAIQNEYSNTQLMAISDVKDVLDYDLIFLGYWVNRGTADDLTQQFLQGLKDKKVAVFGTSGQYSDSPYSLKYKNRVKALVEENNKYIDGFICIGKIEESRTEKRKLIQPGQPHYLTEEGLKRHIESRKHPDETDIYNLLKWVDDILGRL